MDDGFNYVVNKGSLPQRCLFLFYMEQITMERFRLQTLAVFYCKNEVKSIITVPNLFCIMKYWAS